MYPVRRLPGRLCAAFAALAALLAIFLPQVVAARDTPLQLAADLRADSALAAQAGIPIILLFSLADCAYCEEVRRSHLTPMSRAQSPKAIIRQIDIKSAQPLIGFDGATITHAAFAKSAKVSFAPVVAFYAGNGETAAEPLNGALLPDFYGSYLENALTAATAKARIAPHRKNRSIVDQEPPTR
jgi:thioredoxin-related protein